MTTLLLLVLASLFAVPAAAQNPHDHHAQLNARGAHAMGFDQTKTTHHFYLYEDGGSIQVTVNDAADKTNLIAIRTHLPHIAQMFAAGDFTTPHFVHDQAVPGANAMSRLRDHIVYRYEELPGGGRVRISTDHALALAAVHEFLRYQITDHKTGDSLQVVPEKP
jgi:hypothetical protein